METSEQAHFAKWAVLDRVRKNILTTVRKRKMRTPEQKKERRATGNRNNRTPFLTIYLERHLDFPR